MTSWGEPGPSAPAPSAQATSALVSAARPGALTPSSLVTRILTVRPRYRPLARPRLGSSRDVRTPVISPSPPGPGTRLTHADSLVCFNSRHVRPDAPDLGLLAHRAAVADRARSPGGGRLRGGRHPAPLRGRRHPGARWVRPRRVVALGSGPGARPVAEPPGRRALRVQRGQGSGGARRARTPQRDPRPGPLAALDTADAPPEPALAPPAAAPLARATRSRCCSSSSTTSAGTASR